MLYFRCRNCGDRGGGCLSEDGSHHRQARVESSYRWGQGVGGGNRGGGTARRNSTVSSDSRLEIGHQGLTSVIVFPVQLIFSSRVSVFPSLCGQFSALWRLLSWVQPCHPAVNFSTWCSGIYKTAHGMWLRILSIDLEKELKVLDHA